MSFRIRFQHFLQAIRPVYRYEVFLAQTSNTDNITIAKRRLVVKARSRQQAEEKAREFWVSDMKLVTLEPVKRLSKVKR